ncbi:hypothetical protein [Pengzhenrongella frigida]|uniref:Uncharacterized protein n=1 Tax=Pengzhenrongella frigida TaxID=1259133 RepID=A0A4Q5N2D3_9MICO|nr:hypothetical protein [Cellulomonas sp. HLT2-17]RYV52299.1 hypothetical protein EUA98_03560 [Cellulomonas sp. HLT2-17]
MHLRRRAAAAPALALRLPRLDGSSWPDHRAVGRASFEVNTLYELGYREAFEPEAHAIAEAIVDEVLPSIAVDAPAADEPFLRRTFLVAAQVGAGIGIVEARTTGLGELETDRRIWGALWHALQDLPALAPPHRFIAAYLMQSGHYLARTGVAAIPLLLAGLDGEPPGSSA